MCLDTKKYKKTQAAFWAFGICDSLPNLSHHLRIMTLERADLFSVFSFSIGPDNWIVICDFELYKDAMNREEFQNRPVIEPMSDFIFRVSS